METIIEDFTALCLRENGTPPTFNVEKRDNHYYKFKLFRS